MTVYGFRIAGLPGASPAVQKGQRSHVRPWCSDSLSEEPGTQSVTDQSESRPAECSFSPFFFFETVGRKEGRVGYSQ